MVHTPGLVGSREREALRDAFEFGIILGVGIGYGKCILTSAALKKKKNATLATGWVYRVFQRGGMATIFLQFLLREFRCAKTKAIHLLCSGQHSVEQDRFFFFWFCCMQSNLSQDLSASSDTIELLSYSCLHVGRWV